jgi:hypothetical protein
MALFGQGIHESSHQEFEPAHFAFPINKAILAGLKATQEKWTVSFVPRGLLVDGKPAPVKVASPVKIGSLSLAAEMRKPDSRRE